MAKETTQNSPYSYRFYPSTTHKKIEWVELFEGQFTECVILKTDKNTGVKIFFKTNDLDSIDKRRLASILNDRNIDAFELYDIMAQRVLGNGVNALSYFHQLAKQLAPNGQIMEMKSGVIGQVAA